MNSEERARMARAMGLNPAEYEKHRAASAPAPGTMALSGRVADLALQFGIKPADFEAWRAEQIKEGRRRSTTGEPLTQTQRALLEAEPVAIVPTSEEIAAFAASEQRRSSTVTMGVLRRITQSPPSVPVRPTGTLKMAVTGGTP
jgi:hypothetical protein